MPGAGRSRAGRGAKEPFVCGAPREIQGRAPKGWILLKVAGANDKNRWFCSVQCVMLELTGTRQWTAEVRQLLEQPATEQNALTILTHLAGRRERMTTFTVTPRRLERLLELATARLKDLVDRQAAHDASTHRYKYGAWLYMTLDKEDNGRPCEGG